MPRIDRDPPGDPVRLDVPDRIRLRERIRLWRRRGGRSHRPGQFIRRHNVEPLQRLRPWRSGVEHFDDHYVHDRGIVLMSLALWGYATPFANNELAIPDSDIVTTLVAVLEPMGFGHAVATVRRSVGLSSWMPSHSSTGMLRNCYDGGR